MTFSVVKTTSNRLFIKTVTTVVDSMIRNTPVTVDAMISILIPFEEFSNWSPLKNQTHIVHKLS